MAVGEAPATPEWRGGDNSGNGSAYRHPTGDVRPGRPADGATRAMTEPPSRTQILLARVAIALIVGLALAGVVYYGVSTEELDRVWRNIAARPGGPMTFRFVLQPAMAALAALRDGVADARLGRVPYLSAILFRAGRRSGRLWEGIVSTARILILGVVMDIVYQLVFLGEFYPAEAAIIAVLLAFVPYSCCAARSAGWRAVGSRGEARLTACGRRRSQPCRAPRLMICSAGLRGGGRRR